MSKNIFTSFIEWLKKILHIGQTDNEESSSTDLEDSSVSNSTTGENMSGKRTALCVAINNYPGTSNDLRGCINDAKDWGSLLTSQYGFTVSYLLDSAATVKNVTTALKNLIAQAVSGDAVVFTYSGHGSNVPDKNSDETDKRDECICLYDAFLIDDDIRAILNSIKPGVKFTVVSDSCFSGTVTRAVFTQERKGILGAIQRFLNRKNYSKIRYMPPADDAEALRVAGIAPTGRIFSSENMQEVLLTGCNDKEYSSDAYINGRYNGALTYYAIKAVKINPSATYEQFYATLRKSLPSSSYQQTPQLEGAASKLQTKLFV